MRCHVIVHGRVQGVGFRWFVRENARRLGLGGRVLNREDGTVEVEAEGDAHSIDTLVQHLREGPPGSQVSRLEMLAPPAGASNLPNPFTVER